jgi:hypothetical protein
VIKTRPFIPEHANEFQSSSLYQAQFQVWLPDLVRLGSVDQCGTHFLDGRILYISGFCESGPPGVAEVFIFPSVEIYENQLAFYRDVRWWLKYLKDKYRRLQCWGEDTELSKRWLTSLGFLQEGALRNYTADGSSMLIWGMT